MRGRLAAACWIAAIALLSGCAPADRAEPHLQAVADKATGSPGSGERIALTSADQQAAASGGFLPAGARSLLRVDRQLHYDDFVRDDRHVPPGDVEVAVDLRTQIISVFRAGHEIGTAVILYGADGHDTPLGTHPVRSKVLDYRSVTYDAPMPFTLWLTDDGVAIHASDVRQGAATHGCIGVPGGFAERLYQEVEVGDPVIVVRSREPTSLS